MTSKSPEEPTEGRGASVLTNGLAVLRAFTVEEPLQGVSEIAAKVGLHKSTVSRILSTLEAEELVERDPATRRFRLGLGVISLAGPLLANLDVRRVAYPVLTDLSRRTGETAALMLWDGSEAVCVEQVASSHQVKHTTPSAPGIAMPPARVSRPSWPAWTRTRSAPSSRAAPSTTPA